MSKTHLYRDVGRSFLQRAAAHLKQYGEVKIHAEELGRSSIDGSIFTVTKEVDLQAVGLDALKTAKDIRLSEGRNVNNARIWFD